MGTNRQRWTKEERARLVEFFPVISCKRMRELLPHRTEKAIRIEGSELGLKKCPERLAESGRENVSKRYPEVFKRPEPPVQ